MKEKIHDLKTALEVLRIEQTVSFDDCQKLMTDVHDKTGFTPPNFEISGNQWCVLVNLAVARFGNTTPPYVPTERQRKPLSGYINEAGINANDSPHIVVEKLERAIEAAHGIKGNT